MSNNIPFWERRVVDARPWSIFSAGKFGDSVKRNLLAYQARHMKYGGIRPVVHVALAVSIGCYSMARAQTGKYHLKREFH
mmetsp:Transcript_7719/g.11681  ORF Transcript_7719/g.11681 Transcript_7719/m.11681 type:complete len:80 (-) Transcript_7719:184-423(-)